MPKFRSIPVPSLLVITAVLSAASALLLAQGPLNPPGAPAPTMKTLEQIEPRTDLAKVGGDIIVQHRITAPGSYYLSANLNCTAGTCIEIRSSGVTLDLMGFRISRASGSAIAIRIGQSSDVLTDITIKNGHISGPNISSGIMENSSTDPVNVRVTGVTVSNVSANGIHLGADISNSVDRCSVRTTGGAGITAGEVSFSTAVGCQTDAIVAFGNVIHCRGEAITGDGINARGNVSNSWGETDGDDGIFAFSNVANSHGSSGGTLPSSDGIHCTGGNVTNSRGSAGVSGGYGIVAPDHTVSYSFGFSNIDGLDGVRAAIAIGCTSEGGETITNKYLMP